MRAIARHRFGHHLVRETGRLHRAQGFVVDRNRARLMHGGGVTLDQDAGYAIDTEQVSERQPGWASANDGDGKMN